MTPIGTSKESKSSVAELPPVEEVAPKKADKKAGVLSVLVRWCNLSLVVALANFPQQVAEDTTLAALMAPIELAIVPEDDNTKDGPEQLAWL